MSEMIWIKLNGDCSLFSEMNLIITEVEECYKLLSTFSYNECRILQHLFIEMLICQLCIWDHKRGNLARVVYPLGDSYI